MLGKRSNLRKNGNRQKYPAASDLAATGGRTRGDWHDAIVNRHLKPTKCAQAVYFYYWLTAPETRWVNKDTSGSTHLHTRGTIWKSSNATSDGRSALGRAGNRMIWVGSRLVITTRPAACRFWLPVNGGTTFIHPHFIFVCTFTRLLYSETGFVFRLSKPQLNKRANEPRGDELWFFLLTRPNAHPKVCPRALLLLPTQGRHP